MDITCGYSGDYTKLTLAGQLWQREDMNALEQYFKNLPDEHRYLFVLELDRLTFINSQALGLLVKLHSLCEENGGKLILYLPRSTVREVIEIAGLIEFVAIAHSEDELEALMKATEK